MDEVTIITLISCVALAVLVYLMYRAATQESWGELTHNEKKKWRVDEENRKQKK